MCDWCKKTGTRSRVCQLAVVLVAGFSRANRTCDHRCDHACAEGAQEFSYKFGESGITMMMTSMAILLVLLLFLTRTTTLSHASYILCPLGENEADIILDEDGNDWIFAPAMSRNSSNVTAKPCWCITDQSSQFPVFCPPQFDTCRIDSSLHVDCVSLAAMRANHQKWIVPFVGPFCVLLYLALFVGCRTRRGMAARHYLILKCSRTFCSEPYFDQHWSLDRFQQKHPAYMRSILLARGVARERMELREAGIVDASLAPTHLELKTKIYQSSNTDDDDDNNEDSCASDGGEEQLEATSRNEQNDEPTAATDETATIRAVKDDTDTKIAAEQANKGNDQKEAATVVVQGEPASTNNTDDGDDDDTDLEAANNTTTATTITTTPLNEDGYREYTHVATNKSSIIIEEQYDDDDDDGDDNTCAICMCEVHNGERIGDLRCQHLFHVECLKKWLKKKNECPMCCAKDVAQRRG